MKSSSSRKTVDGNDVEREMPSIDPVDFDSLAAAGSMAGSGGVIVMDDSRDMVWALNNINEFYAHESCGQCTPCREGSLWMNKITDRMLLGGGVEQDPTTLKNVADNIAGPNDLRFWRSLRLADAKFRREISRTNLPRRREKPVPPPLPPEYTPKELIEASHRSRPCPLATRSRLRKKPAQPERSENDQVNVSRCR